MKKALFSLIGSILLIVLVIAGAIFFGKFIMEQQTDPPKQTESPPFIPGATIVKATTEPDPADVSEPTYETPSELLEYKAIEAAEAKEAEPTPEPRYDLTEEERTIVEAVVSAEARGEGFIGQCLVAQCILNTAEARDMRPDEVVLEPGQYAAPLYGYADPNGETSFICDAVSAVFDEGYEIISLPIRYFYAPDIVYSEWHEEDLVFAIEHGGHRFFMEP